MCKISVIVPIYNVEKYVGECLESILNQNFDEYEVICVDDVSTDHSMKIVNKYAKKTDKIKIVKHSVNRGLSAARNTGLFASGGKYVWFVDSDDMIEKDSLETLYYMAEANSLDIIYFNMHKIYENEMQERKSKRVIDYSAYSEVCSGPELFSVFAQSGEYKVESWREFISRDFLVRNRIMFYEGILHEDNLFYFQGALNAEKVLNINEEFYIYRQRSGSIMSRMNTNRIESMYIVCAEIYKYWKNNTFNDDTERAIEHFLRRMCRFYVRYREYLPETDKKDIEKPVTPGLSDLFHQVQCPQYVSLSEDMLEQLMGAKYIILYGAGNAAIDIVWILRERGVEIDAIAVSNTNINPKYMSGVQIISIEECLTYRKDATIIVGAIYQYGIEMKNTLEQLGFEHILIPEELGK